MHLYRDEMLERLQEKQGEWDVVVVGGGATGVGIALDAASRGYATALLERFDFGKGTSSRSTKLIHGGVRYLQQGNIPLVMEALKERGLLRNNAPHLVSDLRFIVPNYDWWEAPFYGMGLKVYDLLAGKFGFGPSKLLSKKDTVHRLPTIQTDGLLGGVQYYDGQFDDARLLISMARTAAEQGAALCNYCPVTGLVKNESGYVRGVRARDEEGGSEFTLSARVVINATGPFSDRVRAMDAPDSPPIIEPSQGVHLVLDGSFLPGSTAIMVPHTRDGRVMFALPWHGHTLVGTTDTPLETVETDPRPQPSEIDFILETAAQYLAREPAREDVLSAFAGIRPLVRADGVGKTAALSREHTLDVSPSGLLTIAGGKWTTYRKMAEDAVDCAITLAQLEERECGTRTLNIHGHYARAEQFGALAEYGTDAAEILDRIEEDPSLGKVLHPELPYLAAQVDWAVGEEMARTVEDVLGRRLRATVLRPRAAMAMAPAVAARMSRQLGHSPAWAEEQTSRYLKRAEAYLVPRAS